MKRSLFLPIVAASLLLITRVSYATLLSFSAHLDGPSENPSTGSPGTGFAAVEVDTAAHTMHVHAEFSGLLGNTTAAHIHCCVAPPGNVGVATTVPSFVGFPLGVTSGVFDATLDLTLLSSFNPAFVAAHGGTAAGAEAFLIAGMLDSDSYFNIHTTRNPGGEIRGFLVAEPAMISLLALGLGAGLIATRRRRM